MNPSTNHRICPCCHRPMPIDGCEPSRFERLTDDLEARVELIEKRDWAGLVAYLEQVIARRDGDLYTVKDLGEAYVMNGEPQRAIELLTPVHRRRPDFADVQWVILDALFAQGRDETCFQWTRPLSVLRLGTGVLDACWAYLDRKSEPGDLEELYCELLSLGYLAFNESQLLAALEEDPRFEVDEGPYWTAVGLSSPCHFSEKGRTT